MRVERTFLDSRAFSKFRLHGSGATVNFSEFTVFELMLELTDIGWTYLRKNSSRKQEPYQPGASKDWFFDKSINKHYLQVLLKSEELFKAGLKVIHHFQPVGYYNTLLVLLQLNGNANLLNALQPSQPLSYYKLWMQKAKKGTLQVQPMEIDREDHAGN